MIALTLTLIVLGQSPAAAQASGDAAKAEEAKALPSAPADGAAEGAREPFSRYKAESIEFRKSIEQLLEKKYQDRKEAISSVFEKAIREAETLERRERIDAIAKFEDFLERYPDDKQYTPDVMFRLAELYYERSSDDQMVAMREYEEKLKATDPSQANEALVEPSVDYSKSIALYQRLLVQFPDYRLNDGAYYLLGYCLEKQNQLEASRDVYRRLIARYPKSKFTTEAWVRLGEYYFDAYGEKGALTQAAEAYENALAAKGHPLYDKALYKLGWTYYRMDRFDEAVSRFLLLLDHYEAKAKEKGEEEVGGDLRTEALQYTAISFTDEKWGSLQKAEDTFRKLGGKSYESQIYRRMGHVYFDQTKYPEAIAAYQLSLKLDPLAEEAPQTQQRIVQAYERERDMKAAFAEAERLAAQYGPGSAWAQKHERRSDILAAATDLAEKNLYSAAIYHHQQALALKQSGKLEAAKAAFGDAAKAYATYLSRFPRAKTAYDVQFYYAECLYNSFRFADAAIHYEQVRDSGLDDKYRKDAAFAAVLAWQKEMEQQMKQGNVAAVKPLRSTERGEGDSIAVIPLADVEQRWVKSSDAYVSLFPNEEKAPGVAYKAAELYFAHNDFPEARRRFEEIIQKYPQADVARFSANLIVESYLVSKDWKSVEEVSGRLSQNKEVAGTKGELYGELLKFKLAGRFKLADELLSQGQNEEAAAKYIQLVDEAPQHEFADKALNNAAVAYENARKYDSALKLYERIYREYPRSPLADAALFRVAVNAEKSYDFDKAIASYQKLVSEYPASKDREAALFNAARLLEAQRKYKEAAAAFTRYAALFPRAEDAAKNQYRAALLYEKQNNPEATVRALNEFVRQYSSRPAQVERVIEAKKRIGDAFRQMGNEREAWRAYIAAGNDFDRRKLRPETFPLAADAAAQARFALAEMEFRDFERVKIGGHGKALERSFAAKRARMKRVNDAYAQVFRYKRLEWTLAALYRQGNALERFATNLIETPVPDDVKQLGEEAVVAYQDLVAQQTSALEDKAVESYVATLNEAKKNRLSNEWTKKTMEGLNRFRPREYPLLKQPKQLFATEALFPEGLAQRAQPEEPKP